ncbi:MAG: SsrA-binding protein SmpB [Pseudomonadota bacterium]
MPNKTLGKLVVARNKRAFFQYEISDRFEAGIMLEGSEVKALRHIQASLNEAHADFKNGELYLFNLHIISYNHGLKYKAPEPKRPRKLLLHKREINRIHGAVQRKGYALVALSLYFTTNGLAKIELGLGKGKKLHDKREAIKERDWKRRQAALS